VFATLVPPPSCDTVALALILVDENGIKEIVFFA
jgi:hypothetical protein